MNTTTEINWDQVRDLSDVSILPSGRFKLDPDTLELPDGVQFLYHFDHGVQVEDADGNRFRIMGAGSMQGTVVLRNRYQQMFYAEGDEPYRAA